MSLFGRRHAKASVITLADQARDRQQWELAARFYKKALRRNPANPRIWVQYGHVLKESGRWTEAEMAYRKAIFYDPRGPDSHLQLGRVLRLQGKPEQAVAAHLQALLFEPFPGIRSIALAELGWSETHLSELQK